MTHEEMVRQFHDKTGSFSRDQLAKLTPEGPDSLLTHLLALAKLLDHEARRVQDAIIVIDAGRMACREGNDVPQVIKALRIRLIVEEMYELVDALVRGDVVECADALADLDYVTTGTAIALGIPHEEVFREVHRSNMTKGPLNREAKGGKVGKVGYEPPDVEGAIYRGSEMRKMAGGTTTKPPQSS